MKKFITVILSAILAASLVGCGSNGNGGGSTAAGDVTTEAAGGAVKEYVIATDTSFEPFVIPDAMDSETVTGIDMDIMNAIAEDQGFKVTYNPIGFDAALGAVKTGQADGIIAGASITEERKETFDFSDPYFETSVTMGVAKDSDIKSLEDLKGENVAVKTNTSGATFAKSVQDKYGFTITEFATSPTMYQDVIVGNSAACFEDYPVISYNIQQGADMVVIEEVQESLTEYGFAVKKGENQELLTMFNAGLKNIKDSGKYQEIIDSYIK